MGALTVQYTVSGTAKPDAPSQDYVTLSGQVVIPDGSASATIDVLPFTDSRVEGEETVIVELSASTAYELGDETSATVFIADGPTVDIDMDTDNTGVIERSVYEDREEIKDPGDIIVLADVEPAKLSYSANGQNLTGYELRLSHSQSLKLWTTEDKQSALALTFVIGTDTIPDTIWVEGLDDGRATIVWKLVEPASGEMLHSDFVVATVVSFGLTAYRPQTEGPGYGSPFPKTAVPEQLETLPGAGIRRNGDDDDGDGTPDLNSADRGIAGENDLIEVGLSIPDYGFVEYVLSRTGGDTLAVWGKRNKSGVSFFENYTSVKIDSSGDSTTVWVEWTDTGTVTDSDLVLTIRDARHDQDVVEERIGFYAFKSVVIAFGGNNRAPLDPSAGPFQMATQLYNRGYDVHAYHEGVVDQANSPPFREVSEAVTKRGVSHVAIFGHSYGGGAVYELADQLSRNNPGGGWSLSFTAYIDAVAHDTFLGLDAEERLPPGTQYHVNYYETDTFGVDGEPTQADPLNPVATIINVDVNNTTWGAHLGHGDIDNDPTVQARVLDGYSGAVDPQHDGLTDQVPR